MTAADRPSVTDNARAEAWDEGYEAGRTDAEFPPATLKNPYRAAGRAETTTEQCEPRLSDHGQDKHCRACGVEHRAETTTATDEVYEAGYKSGYHDGYPAGYGAARAETTTATDEDAQTGTFEAILAAHREEYDSDCGMYYGCSCGWDNDDIGSNDGYVEHVARLLATARTRPTRTIYSVQAWEDADGIRASWVTGYGQYTHSRSDAEATLKHQERQHPSATFRLAQAEVTPWTEADR